MKNTSRILATIATTSMLLMSTASAATNISAKQSTYGMKQVQNLVCVIAKTMLKYPPDSDTSGFVQEVYANVSVKLPRTILEQSKVGQKITERSRLQKGDIVFFNLDNSSNSAVTFDGIYLGSNTFAALTTHGLMAIYMKSGYWANKFRFGIRVL